MRTASLLVGILATLALPRTALTEKAAQGTAKADWTADLRLTADPGDSRLAVNFARALAADDLGQLHAVWYDNRTGRWEIYYRRSPDGGTTWEPEQRLSTGRAYDQHPAVAVSGQHVWVVWHRKRSQGVSLLIRRSTDGGLTWGRTRTLTSRAGHAAHASVAATANRVHVVWGDGRDGTAEIYTRRSFDLGLSWEPAIRLSDAPYESWVPSIATAGDKVYVAWVDYRDANEEEYLSRSIDAGITWEPPLRLTTDPADSWAPTIFALRDTLHLAWFDRRSSPHTEVDVELALNAALELIGLSPSPPPPRDPEVYYLPLFNQRIQEKLEAVLAAAPTWVQAGGDLSLLDSLLEEFENRHLTWQGGWEIFYKRSTDGGESWSRDRRLTRAPQASARPSIAAKGNKVHLVWHDLRHGASEIFYKQSTNRGQTWRRARRLTHSPGRSAHANVALDGTGVHVLWFDERDGNPEIYYKRRDG
jgi:hypothetical protein